MDKRAFWGAISVAVGAFVIGAGLWFAIRDKLLGWSIMGLGAAGVAGALAMAAVRNRQVRARAVPEGTSSFARYDWNLQRAYRYVCDEHYRGVYPEGPTDGPLMVFQDIRRRAEAGDLTVIGRATTGNPNLAYIDAKPFVPIPREHWRDMEFDARSYIFGTGERLIREAQTMVDSDFKRDRRTSYWDLMVSSAEVKRLWPPRKK